MEILSTSTSVASSNFQKTDVKTSSSESFSDYLTATESASGSLSSEETERERLEKYFFESPAKRWVENWLAAHDITQEQYEAMTPEQKEALNKEMQQDFEDEMKRRLENLSGVHR